MAMQHAWQTGRVLPPDKSLGSSLANVYRPAASSTAGGLLLPSAAQCAFSLDAMARQREAQLRQIAIAPSHATCCTKQLATATRIALFIVGRTRAGVRVCIASVGGAGGNPGWRRLAG